MRNLTILSRGGVQLLNNHILGQCRSGSEEPKRSIGQPLCVDVTEKQTYIVVGDADNMSYLVSIQTRSERHVGDLNNQNYNIVAALPFPASNAEIVGMQFLLECESVFIALRSGDIMTINVGSDAGGGDSEGEKDTMIVGTVDTGIMNAVWSPDEEILCLVTGECKAILMTQDFDVLEEFLIERESEGEEAQVALGWGKKETQYHGKAGKAAALAPVEKIKSTITENDDLQTRVSWSGDGAFFAISYCTQTTRMLRVFSREGRLQSICESIKGLEHVMSWRPSGRVIAATEILEHRHDVVFFERNGLRHGEFTLGSNVVKVLDLTWNSDSTILAVTCVKQICEDTAEVCVDLWTDKNYHWYLKQEVRSSAIGDTISHAVWDIESPHRLHIASESTYTYIDLFNTPAVAHVASEFSNSAASVIDGSQVLYTPFKYANVPPPMALHTLKLAAPATHVAFSGFDDGNNIAVLLSDGVTAVTFKCGHAKTVRDDIPPVKAAEVELFDKTAYPTLSLRQIAWPSKDSIIALGTVVSSTGECQDVVSLTKLSDNERIHSSVLFMSNFDPAYAVRLTSAPNAFESSQVILELCDGQVLSVNYETETLSTSPLGKLGAMCVDVDAVSIDNGKSVAVGRTQRDQLFINDHLVSSSCSSFFLRSDFIVLTTTTHMLRFIAINHNLTSATLADDDQSTTTKAKYDETIRSIERGSYIVLAFPAGDRVVFQMPRGNLETVRPRALVLASVRRMLDSRQYRDALVTCRINRIDINIINDHNPEQFMGDLGLFVEQVDDPDLLNLFVSGLRDEDVTKSMYTGFSTVELNKTDLAPDASVAVNGKTTKICRAIRPILQSAPDSKRFVPTILTTFMSETPSDIPSALRLLLPMSAEDRDSALTYLLFLSEIDAVYNAALGLYDLPLALLVAQRSQRDPREYLVALGKLNSIQNESYRRFKIDQQLGRDNLALENIYFAYKETCASPDSASLKSDELWTDLCNFVVEKEIYTSAIKVLADSPMLQTIYCKFGDYQASKEEWANAAASYLLGGSLQNAVNAFVNAREWREALAVSSLPEAKYSVQEIHDVAVNASSILADHHQFLEAANILLDYTEEDENAVELLVKGRHWHEAVRHSMLRDRADLVETTIKPGVIEAYESISEDIQEIGEGFETKLTRLREVRAKPLEVLVNQHMNMAVSESPLDNVDVMSDTASMASNFSTFTATVTNATSRVTGSTARRISKNRRKAERKKVRGKKGSVYEESYLVDSLSKLIDRARVHQSGVRSINLVLISYGHSSQAQVLQNSFAALVDTILLNASYIFDEQRVQMQVGPNGDPEPVPPEINEHGLPSQPKHPKPVLPTMLWKIAALQL